MRRDEDQIYNASLRVTTFASMCDLIHEAEGLPGFSEKKKELLQVLAHEAFRLVSIQTTDWAKIDALFRLHSRLGFTRPNARLATEIAYAECALDFADEHDCRAAIDHLSNSLIELHDSLSESERARLKKSVEGLNQRLLNR